jgi:hypothetical protein
MKPGAGEFTATTSPGLLLMAVSRTCEEEVVLDCDLLDSIATTQLLTAAG